VYGRVGSTKRGGGMKRGLKLWSGDVEYQGQRMPLWTRDSLVFVMCM
jgi:hypothetical protein